MSPVIKLHLACEKDLQVDWTMEKAKSQYQRVRKSNFLNGAAVPFLATVAFSVHENGRQHLSFKTTSLALQDSLNTICGTSDSVRYPGQDGFYELWARPLNQARYIAPAAIIRPKSPEEVAAIVRCAAMHNLKVQAKSGGHSYANYGLGGNSGCISIDLKVPDFQYVILDRITGQARIGSGSQLLEIDKILHLEGKRTFPHGICPAVGIGGHATVGGLGPMSRLWGTCLDHILEVEVVTSNGRIVKASENENSDLFFALRGAGAGFGIITEFVIQTRPEIDRVVQFTRSFNKRNLNQMVDQFQAWQELIADPTLDRRFGTEFWLNAKGAEIRATFYGSEAEFIKSGILDLMPRGEDRLVERSWKDTHKWQTDNAEMYKSDLPTEFCGHSLGFTRQAMLSRETTRQIFESLHKNAARSGALKWAIIFDATGGSISEVPMDATAYAHRDKVMFYQSYALNVFKMSEKVPKFLAEIHKTILNNLPKGMQHSTYPGFVDPALVDAQQVYWGFNLPKLEIVKSKWDPTDIFHNPQSVRPGSKLESFPKRSMGR